MKRDQVALIGEDRCIGCTLCIEACPVDAIIGAQGLMHTVVEPWCIGCALCLPPCPVDCIDMIPAQGPWTDALRRAAGARGKRRIARISNSTIKSNNVNRKEILEAALARKRR